MKHLAIFLLCAVAALCITKVTVRFIDDARRERDEMRRRINEQGKALLEAIETVERVRSECLPRRLPEWGSL